MASSHEGFPTTLLEATSYGIPIVAYNAPGGIAEIIEDGVNGFLIKENNEVTFALTIEKALAYKFENKKIQQQTQLKFSLQNYIKLPDQPTQLGIYPIPLFVLIASLIGQSPQKPNQNTD